MVKIINNTADGQLHRELEIGTHNWDAAENLALAQLKMEALFPTVALQATQAPSELPLASKLLDVESLMFTDFLHGGRELSGEQYLNRRVFNDALIVIHDGAVLHESYRNGMCAEDRHVLHSCTKSLCAMLIAVAVAEGLMRREAQITEYVPPLGELPAWNSVSLQQVLDMQAGIEYSEEYTDPQADYWSYARAAGYYPPLPQEEAVGVKAWILNNLTERCAVPGEQFAYNSCLTNVLGMALENVYACGLAQLFEEKLYQRIGAEADGYFNTDRFGFPIAEGQFNLRLRDFARLALLMCNEGKSQSGEQVLPPGFVERVVNPDPGAQRAYQAVVPDKVFPDGQYKEQFWVLDPAQRQFTMLGIHGQFAWYDLNHKLLIAGFGSYPQQDGLVMMTALKTLWHTIARRVSTGNT